MDNEGKQKFDRDLEADPRKQGQTIDPNVLAVMAAARMPQQRSGFASPGGEWKPGEQR